MITIISFLAILFYLCAGALQGLHLIGKLSRYRGCILTLAGFAVILHASLLYHWIDIGPGQNLTFFNVLSQVAWLIAVLVILFALIKPTDNLGAIIFPLAALTVFFALVFPGYHVINTKANLRQLFHILLSFLAVSVLCLAAVQAFLLALEDWLLKRRRYLAILQAMPPLETMEQLLFQLIALGFVLLSMVLATAVILFPDIFRGDMLKHTLLAIIAWLIFMILLLGRSIFGWRGRVAVSWALSGVFILLIAYFGSQLLLELLV